MGSSVFFNHTIILRKVDSTESAFLSFVYFLKGRLEI